jgi:sterol desaturase/sphingolipid hydroxylase (fatty acid hydroxylase superfamily)
MEFKNIWAISTFITSFVLQIICPHQNIIKNHPRNLINNITLGIINAFFLYVVYGGTLYLAAEISRSSWGGVFALLHLPYILQIILTVFIYDLLTYALHKIYHQIPFLWHLHAAHHSDNVFETTTALRFHPIEVLMSYSIRILIAYILGIPILGYVIYEALFQFFNFTQHSDFNLNARWDNFFSLVFVTPAAHRRHHSVVSADLNSNYSTIFVFWDKFFKTWNHTHPEEKIQVGCADDDKMQNFKGLIIYPLQKFFETLKL